MARDVCRGEVRGTRGLIVQVGGGGVRNKSKIGVVDRTEKAIAFVGTYLVYLYIHTCTCTHAYYINTHIAIGSRARARVCKLAGGDDLYCQ